ncbi:helix-turn-helix transcriptional regulator [Priestia megaterium]|uniref:helix-turn-helix transcriptional regulator n=1 Tax=Priestia megaterium TaxID=1404 RepID=UPI0004704FE8|nr:helix-turn-helix transcriptional regulator [Priestia megaterium]
MSQEPNISEKDIQLVTKNLKILRQAMNWTQEDLAKRVGVTRQTITAIESGKKTPSNTLIIAILGLFLTITTTIPVIGKVIKALLETTGLLDILTKLIGNQKN